MANWRGAFRRFWLNVHLWIGIGVGLLSVPIAISGGLLVFHDEIEAWLHPARYAVTRTETALGPNAFIDASRAVLPRGLQPSVIRFGGDAEPVVVNARRRGGEGDPPVNLNIYLDPGSARVLDVADAGSSFFGFLHRFHENLTIPQFSGRAIVGWVGVAMLISSLSGIYLWWPRNGRFVPGLRWRRSDSVNSNLHHLMGFWISIPLAVVSATGIYLGFPAQGRDLLSSMTPLSPRPAFGQPARQTSLTADQALDKALTAVPGAKPVAVFYATAARGGDPVWRVQLREPGAAQPQTVMVDDRSGNTATIMPLAGDKIAQWIRWIHEGSHAGLLWKLIALLCGALPPLFAITGVVMWLRRSRVKRSRHNGAAELSPAE